MNDQARSKLTVALQAAIHRDPLAAIATTFNFAMPGFVRLVRELPSPLAKVPLDPELAEALAGAAAEFEEGERVKLDQARAAKAAERDKLEPIMQLVPFGNPLAPPPLIDPVTAEKRYLAVLDGNPDLAAHAKGRFLTDCWCAEIFIKSACTITVMPREANEGHRQWQDGRCSDWLRSNGYIGAEHLINFHAFMVAALAAGVPVRRAGSGPMATWFGLKLPAGREFRPGTVRVA